MESLSPYSSHAFLDFVLAALFLACLWQLCRLFPTSRRTRLAYPPGPPPTLFIGNMLDFPYDNQWVTFRQWGSRYGKLAYTSILGSHIVIVNSLETIVEMFEKRYNIYSSRTPTPMLDLMRNNHFSSSLPYGNRWRVHRRMIQSFLHEEESKRYRPIQTDKVQVLLRLLAQRPEQFLLHIRYSTLAIVMSTLYDYDVAYADDPYLEIAEKAVANLTKTILPGSFLVNSIPLLRFLPEWCPGGGFKTFARETQDLVDRMRDGPLSMVQSRMASGEKLGCIAAKLLGECKTEEDLVNVKSVCTTLYAAGAESTVSTIQTFFYAMANNEEAQCRAQEEIDRVLSINRLPTFSDRESLPYVEALYRETLRWQPVFPVGGPHYSTEEDVYEGYRIPKGTTVIPNVWGITRDPRRYVDPETFDPARFLDDYDGLIDDHVHYVFGFGRRTCPGRHFASATVWLTIANVLASFKISKKKDATGRIIPVNGGYTGNALAIHPHPFVCDIVPRSKVARNFELNV